MQITRTTPRRRTILHLSQIRLTDALTFMTESLFDHRDYPPAPQILRRQLQPDPIADQHPHEVATGAAGGVRDANDLALLARAGVSGALVATSLHNGKLTGAQIARLSG